MHRFFPHQVLVFLLCIALVAPSQAQELYDVTRGFQGFTNLYDAAQNPENGDLFIIYMEYTDDWALYGVTAKLKNNGTYKLRKRRLLDADAYSAQYPYIQWNPLTQRFLVMMSQRPGGSGAEFISFKRNGRRNGPAAAPFLEEATSSAVFTLARDAEGAVTDVMLIAKNRTGTNIDMYWLDPETLDITKGPVSVAGAEKKESAFGATGGQSRLRQNTDGSFLLIMTRRVDETTDNNPGGSMPFAYLINEKGKQKGRILLSNLAVHEMSGAQISKKTYLFSGIKQGENRFVENVLTRTNKRLKQKSLPENQTINNLGFNDRILLVKGREPGEVWQVTLQTHRVQVHSLNSDGSLNESLADITFVVPLELYEHDHIALDYCPATGGVLVIVRTLGEQHPSSQYTAIQIDIDNQ